MTTILLATHNQGKIKRYKQLFADLEDLKLVTLAELDIDLKVDEPFSTSAENSAHKAREYGRLSNLPAISIDEAVITNFLPEGQQPGVLVRRFKTGRELTDQEMLEQWQEILSQYLDDNRQFVWDFCMSYYQPENDELKIVKAVQIDSVAKEFSPVIDPGYPMSSFLIPEMFDKPYSELTAEEFLLSDQTTLKPFLDFMTELVNNK